MSDDEDSNASQEEDNGEENEEEGEENEDEGEENEDDEGSEGEENEDDEEEDKDDEGSEEDDDDDKEDKKKKKKKEEKGKKTDLKNEKAEEQNDTKNNPSNNNDNVFLSNLPPKPQSILSILDEISNEMDSLTQELNTVFSRSNYSYSVPYSQPVTHDVNRENEEIKKLIAQANSLSTEIDNNLKSHPQSEDKCVGSDDEDNNNNNYQPTAEAYSPLYTTEPQAHRNYSPKQYNPYDWNKNIEYYNALNNRNRNKTEQFNANNNPFIQQEHYHTMNSTGSNHFQSSRVKKMDDLYLGEGLNKRPIVYSQDRNPGNNNYNINYQRKEYPNNNSNSGNNYNYNNENQKNNNNNDYNEYNNQQQPKPFERYKPKSISQAMDILLDKQ